MSSIPTFHYKAVEDAGARTQAAKSERDRADSFLAELDDVLAAALEVVTGSGRTAESR